MTLRVGDLDAAACRSHLRSARGLPVRTGPFVVAIRSPLPHVAQAVQSLYRHHETPADEVVDFTVQVSAGRGVRRWYRPQAVFRVEGEPPFNPLPLDQAFPLLEWGLNWCVYAMCHQFLILHAAVLERGGRALILPAPSGSGKSTLCAALALSGWRLLSDELALIRPSDGRLLPIPRPVSLKNASIDVIQARWPDIRFESRVSETSKGVVAHFAPPAAAVESSRVPAAPGWVVLPRYVAGADARLEPLERAQTLVELVQNAFNYNVFGLEGFELLSSLVTDSECFTFEYADLGEAIDLFGSLAHRADSR